MGGPVRDNSGSIAMHDGVDAEESKRIFLEDPFVASGVFALDEVLGGTMFVGELSGSG